MESELVRKAIEHRIAGGSVGEVVREWTAQGVTGTRGGRPNPQALTQIMTSPRVCGFRANRGELLIDPATKQPLIGGWQAIVTPEQWRAVCATFSAGSLYMHRGPLSPRLTDGRSGAEYPASGFLRCGALLPDESECGQLMAGSKNARSRKSPYGYTCIAGRGCGRCAISGPLVDDAVERLLMPGDGRGPIRLPEPMRMRWQSGEMDFEEKRRVMSSVLVHLVVRPGRKGCQTWDYTRVVPVWKWADRIRPMDPAA